MIKSRIGVLGGTFDPIHNGHLGLAIEAIDKLALKTVFLVPSFLSPNKVNQHITPINIRIQMARLAVETYSNIRVSILEAERGGLSYTVDTMEFFSKKFSNDEIFFLGGMDSFVDMGVWRDFQKIFKLSNLVIAPRQGIKTPDIMKCLKDWFGAKNPYTKVDSDKFLAKFIRKDNNNQITFLQLNQCPAASNEIRAMVAQGREVKKLLPAKVENYIIKHRLYQV